MPECEVCGKAAPSAKKAEIDGVVLSVCEECAKLGKQVYESRPVTLARTSSIASQPRPDSIEGGKELAEDFSTQIRKARERMSLTREEAAMKMGISFQLYKRIEAGFRPDEKTAKKIERFYNLSIVKKENG